MARHVNPIDQPNQSSDKYYRSRDVSVIGPPTGEGRSLPPGSYTPDFVNPAVSRQADRPRSADVYYKDPAETRRALQNLPPAALNTGLMTVMVREELDEILRAAIWSASQGQRVRVAVADVAWLPAARLKVEQAVTRQTLTEDQGREILFGKYNAPAQDSQAPALKASLTAEDEEFAVAAGTPVPAEPDPEDELPAPPAREPALEFTAPPQPPIVEDDDTDDEQFALKEESPAPRRTQDATEDEVEDEDQDSDDTDVEDTD